MKFGRLRPSHPPGMLRAMTAMARLQKRGPASVVANKRQAISASIRAFVSGPRLLRRVDAPRNDGTGERKTRKGGLRFR
jgi:hypothetical protein